VIIMKKLLHIIAQKPEKTGSGIFVSSLISEAAKKGYEQGLIAGISETDVVDENAELENVVFFPVYFDSEELPFPVVGMSDVMPYQSTRYRDLDDRKLLEWKTAFTEKIQKAIEEFKPELIISHHLWLLSALVCTLTPTIPVVCVCHGTDLRQMELCPKLAESVKRNLQGVKMVLALTEYQTEKIKECYGISKERIKVIGGAYNSSIFYIGKNDKNDKNNSKKIKMIYAGKLSLSKGVLSLIKAYNLLSEVEDTELFVVGSGTGKEKAAIEKAALGCKNKVTFTGVVKQEELAELFRQSDIFILPSFYEGLPLVVLEALASGLRVVVSDLPGLKAWLGNELNNNGVIEYIALPKINNTDIPDEIELPYFESRLAKSIERQIMLIRDNVHIPGYEIEGVMKKHSWKGMLDKFENIFDEVKI
jgi:glycosyltransferase involved in cell wall biosynthesis